jgi:hypothetical protein
MLLGLNSENCLKQSLNKRKTVLNNTLKKNQYFPFYNNPYDYLVLLLKMAEIFIIAFYKEVQF